MESFKANGGLTPNEALHELMRLRQQMEVMGANDYEPGAFVQIQESLEKGEITPDEAVAQAAAILENKQDYH